MPIKPVLTVEPIASPVEVGQSVLIGYVTATSYDPLTLTQTQGSGTISLGLVIAGVQGIWYTAPASAAGSPIDSIAYTVRDRFGLGATAPVVNITLDPGPSRSPGSPVALESGESTVVATFTPGLPGDVLSLVDAPDGLSLGPVLPDGTELLTFTAPVGGFASGPQALTYVVADQRGVGNFYTDTVLLDGGPVITIVPAGHVENNQTVVIGTVALGLATDTLTLTQNSGSKGIVTLGSIVNGIQENLYTAPAHVFVSAMDKVSYSIVDQHQNAMAEASSCVQLDQGVSVTQLGSVTLAKGQSAVVDTVTAGLPGDTVTLVQTSAGLGYFTLVETFDGGATQSNQYNVVYTETGSFTTSQRDTAAYQVFDGAAGKRAGDTPYIRLDAGPVATAVAPAAVVKGQSTIIGSVTPGFAGDVDTLRQTGSGAGTVTLSGNKIIYTAAANVTATNTDTVSYVITNQLGSATAGSAAVKVLGAPGTNSDSPISPKTGANFFDLVGGSPVMTFINANNVVLVEGTAKPTIIDNSIGLKIDVGSNNASVIIKNFAADSTGVVDLLYGVGGFTTAAAAQAALVSDGHGGALLSLGSGNGFVDFAGMAPAAVAATHFKIG